MKLKKIKFSKTDIERIIEMAWEDRTSFDAIENQFSIKEDQVKEIMRSNLKKKSYKLWRERVNGRVTKHLKKRSFKVGRHKSSNQGKIKN
jgi:uncharacterized protein (TIGR03643 family)